MNCARHFNYSLCFNLSQFSVLVKLKNFINEGSCEKSDTLFSGLICIHGGPVILNQY